MPKTGLRRDARHSGGGRKVAVVAVVVLLAGASVGAWFWNRASAAAVAEDYMGCIIARITEGDFDRARLKSLLCKRDAAELEREGAQLMTGFVLGGLVNVGFQLQPELEVDVVSAGLAEATVDVTVSAHMGGTSRLETTRAYLIREGFSWKVDAQKSQQQPGAGPID